MATTATPAPLAPAARRRPTHAARRAISRWLKRGALALGGLAIGAAIVRAWLPSPVAVDVATARRGTLEVEVDEDGRTRVLDRFVVSAPISGTLERIELEAGAPVAAGAVIAHIRPPDPALLDARSRDQANAQLAAAAARRKQADAAVARAAAAREQAARDADRAGRLADRGAITASEREREDLASQLADQDLAAAQLARSAAQAELEAARAALAPRASVQATAPVIAPADGRVLRVARDSAGPILAGQPLLEVGDPRKLEVVIDVLSSDAARIAPGMEVALDGWGGDASLRAHVYEVEPSAFTKISALGVEEQRVNIIARVDDPPAALGDGFRVDARIITWRGDVLRVPSSAVFRDHGRWAVYAIAERHARLVPVELGHRGRLDVEIVRGLDEGATVVLHPSDRVGDGVKVEPRAD